MSRIEVIGLGAINLDYLCEVKELVTDSETLIEHIKATPGGSAANTIYGLAKLGIPTGFIGAVGDDENGKLCLKDFEAVGVDTSQIQVKKEAKSGYTLCLSDKLGRRSIYVSPCANSLLDQDDVKLDYLNQARIVHLSSFADDKQFNIQLDLVKGLPNSVKLSFAPGTLYALKGMKALLPLLQKTYILFTNQEEIEHLTGKDLTSGASKCLDLGCHIVVVTLGKGLALESGGVFTSYIRHKDKEYKIAPREETWESQPETTGAGDAYAAGFLFGFLKEKSLERCGQLGELMARFAMRKAGAREGLPSLNVILSHC